MKGRKNRPWERGKDYGEIPSGWDAYADWEKWISSKLTDEMQEEAENMDVLLRVMFYSIMCDLCDSKAKRRGEG
jgi:hypothetical protein